MQEYHSVSMVAAREVLDAIDQRHNQVGTRLAQAHGFSLYGPNLLAYAALNRSKSNTSAFKSLVDSGNLIAAGPFVRMQLDTAVRFHAFRLVDDPHEFVMAMFDGKPIRDMCDRGGRKLSDNYLVAQFVEEFPWVKRVYDRGSGYVHLSGVHLCGAIDARPSPTSSEHLRFEARITDVVKPMPEWLWTETVDVFCTITELLFQLVGDWINGPGDPRPTGDA
jgi:hypothetical protein